MTIQEFIASLSYAEKLEALAMLELSIAESKPPQEIPAWHEEVLRKRLANPDPGPSLELKESFEEIRARRQRLTKDINRDG